MGNRAALLLLKQEESLDLEIFFPSVFLWECCPYFLQNELFVRGMVKEISSQVSALNLIKWREGPFSFTSNLVKIIHSLKITELGIISIIYDLFPSGIILKST